ncbi:MAG: cytochrome P450 [Rhizobacter sp.]
MDTPVAAPATPPAVMTPPTAARPLAQVPGPRGWPLLGNLPQIDPARMHTQLERWVDEFGPVYRVQLGPRSALVVAQSELIATLLRDRPDGWRRMKAMQTVIAEMGAHGVFSAEGDDWRSQRRLVMKAFDPGHLKRYFPSLVRVTERLRECLDAAARSGEAVDLQTLLMRYTVDVTAGLAFGIDMNTQQHPDNALRGHLEQVFPMLMKRIFAPFPWWRHVRLPSDRAFERHLAQVHQAIGGFIAAARERIQRNPQLAEQPTNLLEALIVASDEEGSCLSEEALVGNVLTVLLAGEDTTANTLGWTLHLLHTHRAEWDALVAHVDTALGDNKLPSDFDVARAFEPIEHCVNEAMRLYPVAPMALYECNRDTTLGDVALSRGSTVMCLTRPGAVNTSLASDAGTFRPQRWGDAAADEAARSLLKASMPFGAGPRLCPGRYLAMLEMKMVLATIARNFEIVNVSTGDGSPPEERLAFTMFPVGLKIRVAARSTR